MSISPVLHVFTIVSGGFVFGPITFKLPSVRLCWTANHYSSYIKHASQQPACSDQHTVAPMIKEIVQVRDQASCRGERGRPPARVQIKAGTIWLMIKPPLDGYIVMEQMLRVPTTLIYIGSRTEKRLGIRRRIQEHTSFSILPQGPSYIGQPATSTSSISRTAFARKGMRPALTLPKRLNSSMASFEPWYWLASWYDWKELRPGF